MNRHTLPLLAALLFTISTQPVRADEAKHDFAKWEREIAAFEQSDQTNHPPSNALLFIGSSTIRLWKTLAQDFPDHPVINRGFGGSEIADATHFADRLIFPHAPKLIFLRAGGNDLHNGKTVAEVFADYQEFVKAVRGKLPEVEIVFISLSPSLARWEQHEKEQAVNRLIADYAKLHPRLGYIEDYDMVLGADGQPRAELFIGDKLHFNAAGYKLLAERVRPFVPTK
jgi:lysophospholipase L1-like esterase